VYRNGVFLASSVTTSYSDTTAQAATTYSYTVYAYDAAGNVSAASNTATATTPSQGDTQPPSTPGGLTATAASPSQVNLAWSAATDDVGVAGYTIYRNGAAIATTSGPNATTYTDVSVAPSTTYTYTVDAFDAAGNRSPQSAGASVTTPPSNIHTITLNPTADTYIDSANPTVNHGTSAQLRVDGSPLVDSFLKFDLSAVPGTITGLTLNIYATSSSGAGYAVRSVADNSWSESTLAWNNAPPIGMADAGQSGAFAANTLTTVNVSSLSNGNGMLSMAMIGINSTAIAFSSREGTVKPQLVVSYQS
jgi:chitodextrinase